MQRIAVPERGDAEYPPIADSPGNIRAVYSVQAKLGNGAFGSVWKVAHIRSGTLAAVKTVARQRQRITYADAEKADLYECLRRARRRDAERLREEIEIMKVLGDHAGQEHVVRLLDTFEDQDNLHLVMELCTGGELIDFLFHAKVFTELHASLLLRQMLQGIAYMHAKHIVHRDIKPENTLLAYNCPLESNVVKLSDFGLSCVCPPDEFLKQPCGTISFIAPQVLRGHYNHAADLWSCGIVAYLLLCGRLPFCGKKDETLLARIKRGNYAFSSSGWKLVADDAKDLIRGLLKHSPEERAKPADALAHRWVRDCKPFHAELNLHSVMDNLQKYYKVPSGGGGDVEKLGKPSEVEPAQMIDWETMSAQSSVSQMSQMTTGWYESAMYAGNYVANGAWSALNAAKSMVPATTTGPSKSLTTAPPTPVVAGPVLHPSPRPAEPPDDPRDKTELLWSSIPIDEGFPDAPPSRIPKPKPFLKSPAGGEHRTGQSRNSDVGHDGARPSPGPFVCVGADDSRVGVASPRNEPDLHSSGGSSADLEQRAEPPAPGTHAVPEQGGMYKGKPVEFFSESHNAWIPCGIMAVDPVMVSAKRGAWISKEKQAGKVREQVITQPADHPVRADSAVGSASWHPGQMVEYQSATAGRWIAAQVTHVDATGNVMLNVKPGVWMNRAKQAERVRVLRKGSIHQDSHAGAHAGNPQDVRPDVIDISMVGRERF